MSILFPRDKQQTFFLSGPSGRLEAISTWPMQAPHAIAIICHPHPLYQGSMRNKVVTTLAKAMQNLGLATLRFNFRGVGQSEGEYGNFTGEAQDLASVVTWIEQALPELPIWLAGFSFGAYIAAHITNQHADIKQLVTIAPAVNHANFSKLDQIRCPWLIIQGSKDEIVPIADTAAFVAQSKLSINFIQLPIASHFFHGQLIELRHIIEQQLALAINPE